ncbi:MAG TPA: hypothetical protein VGB13_09490 [Candidatus Krumholzibacteria bacterium]|jgi:hypothetical protein
MKRPILLAAVCSLLLCVLGASSLLAVGQESYKFSAPAGTSTHQLGSHTVRVDASARVTIYLVFEGTTVTGAVEPGETVATVTITVIDDDGDEVIFQGLVRKLTPFEFLFPHETGHGEG